MAERPKHSAARRLAIQRQLRLDGAVSVEVLAREMGVSEVTIRRDLTAMEEDGSIRRTHGGAVIQIPRGADQAFAQRESLDSEAKLAIARRALTLVQPDHTLLMNDGSTVLALARELVAAETAVTVVTPGVNVATCLSECPEITAYLLGGQVRHKTLGTVGGFAEEMMKAFNGDLAFIAAEGVSLGEGMTYSYESDANLARLMQRRAAKTIALATARKLGQRDRITAFGAAGIDVLITEARDPALLDPLREAEIEVITVEVDTPAASYA